MDSRYGSTNFRDFTHAQLVEMLAAGRADEVAAAADGWRELANLLDDVALTLQRQNADFDGLWEGPAAAAHASMINAVVDGVRQVAWAARRTGDQVSAAGEALRRAQERMAALGPPPQLRPPDEAVLAAASSPLPYGQARAQAAGRQVAAIRAIQEFQRAQAAANSLTEAAVLIMSQLRDQYLNLEFPRLPDVAEPPTLAPDGTPIYPATPGPPGTRQIFTNVWGNGLQAAAGLPPAQLLQPYLPGQGGYGPPYAPSPLDPGLSDVGDLRDPSVDLPRSGPAPLPGLGGDLGGGAGGGGLGAGGGGFGDGLDLDPDRAVGQSSLAPTLDPAAAAAGRATMGVAAVPPFLGGGFVPPVGGGDLGGRAGDIASWLVGEVEEFGVRTTVVPDLVE
jgi:uncharacterized protein YukE